MSTLKNLHKRVYTTENEEQPFARTSRESTKIRETTFFIRTPPFFLGINYLA